MYSVIFVCEYYFENVPESKMNGLVRIVLTVLSRLSFQSEKENSLTQSNSNWECQGSWLDHPHNTTPVKFVWHSQITQEDDC